MNSSESFIFRSPSGGTNESIANDSNVGIALNSGTGQPLLNSESILPVQSSSSNSNMHEDVENIIEILNSEENESIEHEEDEESSDKSVIESSDRNIYQLIETLHLRPYSEEDEWLNDDDNGYVILNIVEDEFLRYEESNAELLFNFRQQREEEHKSKMRNAIGRKTNISENNHDEYDDTSETMSADLHEVENSLLGQDQDPSVSTVISSNKTDGTKEELDQIEEIDQPEKIKPETVDFLSTSSLPTEAKASRRLSVGEQRRYITY